jgi:tetrathionate reductase subunit A
MTGKRSRTVHSVCLGCNARCGIRFGVCDNKIESVTGNPYHPYNTRGVPLDPAVSPADSMKYSGTLCGKGQEIAGYMSSPYRILRPLKRAGKRGEGKFRPVEWEQLVREICEGGRLFADIGEKRHVPGLRSLLKDAPLSSDAPEHGPLRNAFCFMTGRLQSGRKEFIDRFVKDAFGSINRIGHTDICGIGFRMGNFIFTEGRAVELKADPWKARFVLVFGANVYEALQPGVNTYGAVLAERQARGEVRVVIVDPRAQKASGHAWRWVPVRPGRDGAFAMGMIRRMLDMGSYNRVFLEAPNGMAARKLGNGGYVNASHLVIWSPGHEGHGMFLRAGNVFTGITGEEREKFLVMEVESGKMAAHDTVTRGRLDVDSVIRLHDGKGVRVRSAFNIMKRGVEERTVEEYAALAGVDSALLMEVADAFAADAPLSAVCQYHGAGNYVGGASAAYAVAVLNAMSGSLERSGGYCSGGGGTGRWSSGYYDLKDFPGRRRAYGTRISREKASYEDTTEYMEAVKAGRNPFPAKRMWFPFTKGGLSVEALAGIDEGYPYPVSALFLYFFNPVYSVPGGFRFRQTLKDSGKVPLLVSIDIGINESNIYADYIIPDVTYAEGQYGWLSPHAPVCSFTGVRSPAVSPMTERLPDGRHLSLETFLIDIAIRLGLPGFGKKAVPGEDGGIYPLEKAEDFYLRAFANIALTSGVEADETGPEFVEENYPVAEFASILKADEWKKTASMLARGGVFRPGDHAFDGTAMRNGVKRFVVYNEQLGALRSSLTGERFDGTVVYVPPPEFDEKDYPFILTSYKTALHTQSRTVWHRIAMELHPENHIMMNRADASSRGMREGDMVRVSGPFNRKGVSARLHVTDSVRPGVVAVSISYGHTQLGASCVRVMGGSSYDAPAPGLGAGINPNDLAMLDRRFGNTPFVDPLGGIPDFSSSRVRVSGIQDSDSPVTS